MDEINTATISPKMKKTDSVFSCDLCDKKFKNKSHLRRHKSAVHEDVQFICNECNKSFHRKDNLFRHIIISCKRLQNPTFNCNSCDKTFRCKSILRRHKSAVHEADQFVCNECSKIFQRRDALVRHLRTHTAKENDTTIIVNYKPRDQAFICDLCDTAFANDYTLSRHKSAIHKAKQFICDKCNKVFQRKDNLVRHIRSHAPKENTSYLIRDKPVRKCLNCDASFTNKNMLSEHYERVHGIELEFEYLHFSSFAEVQKWISPCYFNEGTWKTSVDIVKRYRCHRSGNYNHKCKNDESKQKRHLRIIGTKKLQGFCPAEITARENLSDKSCFVTHQKVHVGHNIYDLRTELQFERLSKAEKEDIAKRLIEDVSENAYIQRVRLNDDGITDVDSQFDFDTRKDDHIGVAYTITSGYTLENDPVRVNAFILDNDESIVFYKLPGVKDSTYNVFGDEDVALIYQDAFQRECLLKYGHKLISFDATQSIDSCNYVLHTMLVLDMDYEGIPVAYFLSNRGDVAAIDVFICCIWDYAGRVTTKTVMSGTDEVYHEAYRNISGPPTFSLFCSRHVQKEWSQKLRELITVPGQSKCGADRLRSHEVDSQTNRSSMSAEKLQTLIKDIEGRLNAMSNELDQFSFYCKLTSFLSISDENVRPFIDYFEKVYANKTQYWAACYRLHAGADTDAHVEAFHRVLKYTVGKAKIIRTLAAGLDCIANYNVYRRNKFANKIWRPTVSTKLKNLRKTHQEAEDSIKKQPFVIEMVDAGSWHVGLVSSSDGVIEMYLVERLEVKECRLYDEPCRLRCVYCNSCFHEYRCTCFDSAVANNMCEHIHALSLSFKDQGADASFESNKPPIVSVETSMNVYCEEKIQSDAKYTCEWMKEKVNGIVEELFLRIKPEYAVKFDQFYTQYVRPLPSILDAMLESP